MHRGPTTSSKMSQSRLNKPSGSQPTKYIMGTPQEAAQELKSSNTHISNFHPSPSFLFPSSSFLGERYGSYNKTQAVEGIHLLSW